MKKLLLLFAAILMASTGLWAETVDYLYPVYNTDGVPTSGIKEWKTASVDATVVENASEPVTWTAGWYVVKGSDVTLSQGAICSGNVHLILADGAKLTATGIDKTLDSTPGIRVSGDGNSLVIYGQTAQTGILKATGKTYSAGIGGISTNGLQDGSNITINGGTITADGGSQAAAIGGGLGGNGSNITINGGTVTARGSAAGIGGGIRGNGSNITINGGTVTARGGDGSDGIGNGENATAPSSNIFVATWCIVKAGSSKTPTDVIENTGSDLATSLEGKLNVIVETPKFAVTYGDNITVSPAFDSGAEIEAGTQITVTAADRTADSYGFLGFYEESTFDTHITTGVNNQTYTVMVTDAAISVYARYEKYVSASYVYPVYNDPDDVTKGVKEDWETETVNAYVVTSSATPVTWGEAGKETWYVVTGEDVQLSQGAICAGHVNLILADDAKLTAWGIDDYWSGASSPGIQVSGVGNSLAIYGQTAQSGQLEAIGTSCVAGIGGGECGSGSNITINGGTVTANGGSFGAGIGGGNHGDGSSITINGGTVTANGGDRGAGIGGGNGGAGSSIAINGGTVTANGGDSGAGLGGGYSGSSYNITINDGVVTAEGGTNAVGIGSGDKGAASSNITVSAILTLEAGGTEIANNGGDLAESLEGKRYVTIRNKPTVSVSYIDEKDVSHNINAYVVTSSGTPVILGAAGKETWYVVTDADVELSQGAICKGNVNLILADDAKLTATGIDADVMHEIIGTAGIQVSGINSLTIYGQSNQSGKIIANGGFMAAGIGGGNSADGSNITINGGIVIANGDTGAGIGGGNWGSGSNITINGGTVTANGFEGDGIGGGVNGEGKDIFVATNLIVKAGASDKLATLIENNGNDLAESLKGKQYVTIEPAPTANVSYIDAEGVSHDNINAYVVYSADIPVTWGTAGETSWYVVTGKDVKLSQGAICAGNVNLILADGAKLTATGADNEAGIQVSGDDNSLTIYGQTAQSGQLIAAGGKYSAGIGGGDQGDGSNITINGGIVKANSKSYGAGIGGGNRGAGSNITINGGTVTANGGGGSAGIGGGASGSGSNITINGGTVTTNGGSNGAGIGGGFGGNGSYITINGGTVTATGGLDAAGIGGGWAGPTGPIIFEGGQGSNIIINGGTVTANGGQDAAGIGSGTNGPAASDIFVATILTLKAGSTENPADAITNNGGDLTKSLAGRQYVTITEVFNITANQDPNNKANYYSTFYSGKKAYSVPEGVTAYTGAVDGSVLKLTAIESGIIPAGEAVILRLTEEVYNTATKKQFDLTATTTTATKSDTNELKGTDVAKTLGANDYALSLGQNGVGFYLWKDKSIDAHKAYLTLESPTMAKAFTFMFDDGETTAIEQPAINGKQSGDTYNLNGVRVNDNYKGIVIKNGKKVYQK